MSKTRRVAAVVTLALSACGGGGGGGDAAPPPAVTMPTEALRLTAQAVMDLTELAWALSFDVQNTLVTAPSESARTVNCATSGRTVVSRPLPSLLRIEHQTCLAGGTSLGGQVEAEEAVVTADASGTSWSGTVRMAGFSTTRSGFAQTLSASAIGSGLVGGTSSLGQPMTMQISGLAATRTPDALGRGATLGSALLRVERIPALAGPARDLYALDGCVTITAAGVAAELCIDAGSRIALLENVGNEQLTGRIRWNAGTPGGFDARLRISATGTPGSGALRVELDLDNNGSFEAAATLDRSTDIGLRL